VEFIETPLVDVAAYFEDLLKVEVVLERRALEDVGVGFDTPVTFRIADVTARTALELLLKDRDLTWLPADEVLLITTPEEEANREEGRLYDVHELIGGGALPLTMAGSPGDFDSLCELISSCISPTTWPVGAGPGPIDSLELPGIRAIMVLQSPRVHWEVERLLADLRRIQSRGGNGAAAESKFKTSVVSISPDDAIAEARWKLRRALRKRVAMQFVETPLSDIVDYVGQVADVPVLIDTRALDDVGLAENAAISIDVSDVSLESALNLMLSELDLTWTFFREVLLITTPEEADRMLEVRVYDVTDLLGSYHPNGGPVDDYDGLIHAVTLNIDRYSWNSFGGPGCILLFSGPKLRVLVVSQTERVHQKVEGFLTQLRAMRDEEMAERDRESMSIAPPQAIWGPRSSGIGPGGGMGGEMGGFGAPQNPPNQQPEQGEKTPPASVGGGVF